MLACAPHEHFIHPFCCSVFGFLQPLLQYLISWSFRNLVSSLPNPWVPLLFRSLGKLWYCLSSFSSCPLPFAFVHTPLSIQITAVTNHCIFTGSFPAAYRTVAAITQRLREKSFAFSSSVNSALISSHSFHSQKSRGKVFSWFIQHLAELF